MAESITAMKMQDIILSSYILIIRFPMEKPFKSYDYKPCPMIDQKSSLASPQMAIYLENEDRLLSTSQC